MKMIPLEIKQSNSVTYNGDRITVGTILLQFCFRRTRANELQICRIANRIGRDKRPVFVSLSKPRKTKR